MASFYSKYICFNNVLIMAAYALSVAKLIRGLPGLNVVISSVSMLFIMRGLLPLQLWYRKPVLIGMIEIYVGICWLMVGIM